MNTRSSINRLPDIDYTRGIAGICVLLGHAVQYTSGENYMHNPIWEFIYAFHMPLFAFLSGLFFSVSLKDGPIAFLTKKAKQLLLPLVCWVSIGALITTIITTWNEGFSIERIISYWKPDNYLYSYWFLTSLFKCYLYMYIICKIVKNNKLRILITICIWVLKLHTHVLLPYFILGILYHHFESWVTKNNKSILLLNTMVFIGLYVFMWDGTDTFYFTPTKYLKINPLEIDNIAIAAGLRRTIIGISGSLMVLSMVKFLFQLNKLQLGRSYIIRIGQHTLALYILQGLLLEKPLSYLALDLSITLSFICSLMLVAIEIPLCLTIEQWLATNKWTKLFLLGKGELFKYVDHNKRIPTTQ